MIIAELFAKLGIRPDKKSFAVADSLLGKVKTALAGFLAYKTVHWFGGLVEDTVEAGSKFVDLAQQVGVPIEPLQQLGYAAQLSGSSVDGMAIGLKKLSLNLLEASKGSKEQQKLFRGMGIAVKNADGSLRASEDVIEDLADHFAAMPDGTEKTALAMKTLGKSGAELIPLLNEGSDGIMRMRQEFVDLGAQIDTETAKSLEEFGDQQDKVKYALIGVRNDAVKALLPELKRLVTQFLAWVKANRKLIQQKLKSIMNGIITAVKVLATAIGVLVKVVSFFSDNLDVLMVLLGTVAATFVILKWESIKAAVSSAAAWVAATLPIILLAVLIAALILVVEDLWTWFNGGESVFKDLHGWMVDTFVDAIEFWVDGFKSFFNWVMEKVDFVVDKILGIPRALKKVGKSISSYFTGENSEDVVSPLGEQLKAEDRARKVKQATAVARSLNSSYYGTGELLNANHYQPETPTRPAAGAGTRGSTSVRMGDVHVNVPPGTAGADVGRVVRDAMKEFWDSNMRDAAAGAGGDY